MDDNVPTEFQHLITTNIDPTTDNPEVNANVNRTSSDLAMSFREAGSPSTLSKGEEAELAADYLTDLAWKGTGLTETEREELQKSSGGDADGCELETDWQEYALTFDDPRIGLAAARAGQQVARELQHYVLGKVRARMPEITAEVMAKLVARQTKGETLTKLISKARELEADAEFDGENEESQRWGVLAKTIERTAERVAAEV